MTSGAKPAGMQCTMAIESLRCIPFIALGDACKVASSAAIASAVRAGCGNVDAQGIASAVEEALSCVQRWSAAQAVVFPGRTVNDKEGSVWVDGFTVGGITPGAPASGLAASSPCDPAR